LRPRALYGSGGNYDTLLNRTNYPIVYGSTVCFLCQQLDNKMAAHLDDGRGAASGGAGGRGGGAGGAGGGGGGGGKEGHLLVGWSAMDCLYHGFCASGCTQVGCGFRHRDLRTDDRSLCPDWTARGRGAGLPTCPRGADCTATHPSVMVLGLHDCALYLAGGPDACNADTCWLRHSPAVADAAQRGTAKVCRHWLDSCCHAGVACPYVHTTGRTPATMTSFGFDFLTRMLLSRPSPTPPSRRRRVFVAWDIENAGLPSDAVVSHVMATLREKLGEVLHLDERVMVVDTMAFYNSHPPDAECGILTAAVVGNLRVAGVLVVDVGDKKGAADHALKEVVARKLRERADGLPLEAIAVVTGDGDFASTLRDIREEGCTAVLVAGPRPKREMVDEARIKVYWKEVLEAARTAPRGASPHPPTPKPTPPPHSTAGSIPFHSSPLASGTPRQSMSAAVRLPATTRPPGAMPLPGAMPSPAASVLLPAPASRSPTTAAAVAAALLAASPPAAARLHTGGTAASSPSAASSPAQYAGWVLSGMGGRDGH